MVRLLVFILFPFLVWSQEVTVTSSVEESQGTVTVTHNEKRKIDVKSFSLEGKPLDVQFVKDVRISPKDPLLVSVYRFDRPEQKPGLHVLPEISVKVGGKIYKSIPTTYEVKNGVATASPPLTGAILRLEPFIDGKRMLYPGQRVHVGYRYIFNISFDLSKEIIPLLEAKDFKKIGEKEFKDSTVDGVTTLTVTQLVEAEKVGEFTFGPSEIRGRAYKTNALGVKEYFGPEYEAKAPNITLKVLPFPEKDKPGSFNGAIGQYTFELSLLSPSEVYVGEKMIVSIKISGKGELENLLMPRICCQPGFSGVFKVGDLPPIEQMTGTEKTFIVELRPQSEEIKEIPPLEFSFFNPDTEKYTTLKSKPIPITVNPVKGEPLQESSSLPVAKAIEIEGNYPLTVTDLENRPFGTWWVLLAVPIGSLLLSYQRAMRAKLILDQTHVKPKTSQELFREFLQTDPGSPSFYQNLREAIMLRLKERGEVIDLQTPAENLAPGPARDFLIKIERVRFAGKEKAQEEALVVEAKILFERLGHE